jgi:hypothetical protein
LKNPVIFNQDDTCSLLCLNTETGNQTEVMFDRDDLQTLLIHPVNNWTVARTSEQNPTQYALGFAMGKMFYFHRIIMQYAGHDQVCHLNGIGTDCQKSNLRIMNRSDHSKLDSLRHHSARKNSKTGVRGVQLRKGKKGVFEVNVCDKYLGTFTSLEQADKAARAERDRLFNERRAA